MSKTESNQTAWITRLRNGLSLLFSLLFISHVCGEAAPQERKLKVLLIDGQNNHNWKATTPVMEKTLVGTGRFEVEVLTTPPKRSKAEAWEEFKPQFDQYDLVLLNYFGQDWSEAIHEQLKKYVADGGGMAVVHAAVAPFPGREAFNRMIGLGWRPAAAGKRLALDLLGNPVREEPGKGPGAGHGARVAYMVHARAPQHPILAGLPEAWMHTRDELYHGLRGPAENMTILATGFSPATRLNEPLLWTVRFGEGRVFVSVLGHDGESMSCVGFKATLARGCEWAGSKKVTLEVPLNFPNAKKTSVGEIALPRPGAPSVKVIEKHIDPAVKVYGAYAAVKLPIVKGPPFHNPTAITVGPDEKLYVANYTGQIMRLDDTDDDGLEDTTVLFADISKDGKEHPSEDAKSFRGSPAHGGLRYPTGLVFKGNDCYVATTQEIRIYRDTDGDGTADQSEQFATGWPFTMHYFDWTFGLRFGPDGYLYTILCTDYLNAGRKPDPKGMRGSLLRIGPDGKDIEVFCNGLRYAYDLAFNDAGDLFFTDNKGGGNPTEELNHAVKGGNYGHNPHKGKKHAPPRDPLLKIKNNSAATGLEFNSAKNDFGGTAGDLFIAMWGPDGRWSMGAINRTRLTKKEDGTYEAEEHRFSDGPAKIIDLCFAPGGDLYVARFGREGRGHTPFTKPEGDVYRFIHTPWLSVPSAPGDINPLKRSLAGDLSKGKEIFDRQKCATCHTVDGSAAGLGPDLKEIGAILDRDGLLESMIEPSKSIKTDYETHQIVTRDEVVLQGRLLGSDEEQITLMTSAEKKESIKREDIEKMQTIPISMMPTGQIAGLKQEEVDDLMSYLQSLGAPRPEVRINAGGPEVIDSDGQQWLADRDYSKGSFGAVGGRKYTGRGIRDPLLKTCRYSHGAYRFDAADGQYEVTLIASEPAFRRAGSRVFSVRIEGEVKVTDLDLFKRFGFGKPFTETFETTVTDGRLDIEFTARTNFSLVSAIKVRQLSSEKAKPEAKPVQPIEKKPAQSNEKKPAAASPTREWKETPGALSLMRKGQALWTFNYDKKEGKPYFHPVRTSRGHDLTWLRPNDHPWHRALWFSWKKINGLNYWEEDRRTGRSAGRTDIVDTKIVRNEDCSAAIRIDLSYHPPGKPPVLTEQRTIDVQPPDSDGSYRMDWHQIFTVGKEAITLDRTPPKSKGGPAHGGYAGLSFRAAKSMAAHLVTDSNGWKNGGRLVGHGQKAKWMDFSGNVDAGNPTEAGLAIFDHPTNPRHPTPWYVYMAGHFGYFSPALLYDEPLKLQPGEKLQLFYRVLIHPDRLSPRVLDAKWQEFAKVRPPAE